MTQKRDTVIAFGRVDQFLCVLFFGKGLNMQTAGSILRIQIGIGRWNGICRKADWLLGVLSTTVCFYPCYSKQLSKIG